MTFVAYKESDPTPEISKKSHKKRPNPGYPDKTSQEATHPEKPGQNLTRSGRPTLNLERYVKPEINFFRLGEQVTMARAP